MADRDKKEIKKQNAIQRYVRETVGELRKVNWPTRQEATNLTLIVLVVMAFMGIVLGLIEAGSGALLKWALGF